MNDETALISFKAICNFVNELESQYGKKHKPLRFYKRLVNHTQISHDGAIKKHIGVFQTFCIANRESFATRDSQKLLETKITYSDRIYIDMALIFGMADVETTSTIWRHLLTISAIVDPTGKAKEMLKKAAIDDKNVSVETEFLQNIISKVEKNVKQDANPMEAVSELLQSGVLNEMMSDLSDKKLDMGKLLGVVQGMMSQISGNDNNTQQAMGMLTNMMSGLGNANGPSSDNNVPDLSGMMSMMMNMMSKDLPKNN